MNKRFVAGIDIGNATTETALAEITPGGLAFVSEGIVKTTGTKGTSQNIQGIMSSLKRALDAVNARYSDLEWIALNEAAPVIGDVAMETITETIITESTMIGHNPDTPGGLGLGVGITLDISALATANSQDHYILVADKSHDFLWIAEQINAALEQKIQIKGVILQRDDGVLVSNRLRTVLPIIDEVLLIEKVPLGVLAAVEVVPMGRVIEQLSNPYGIATVFALTAEQTRMIVPIARALIGNRSAVVIKTRSGDVQAKVIPAGHIKFIGQKRTLSINVDEGADAIMQTLNQCFPLNDIQGESGTHAGGMLERVRQTMATLTLSAPQTIKIQDLLAINTFIPQKVQGGLAGEFAMENAVGIAAMVKADRLQMNVLAQEITDTLKVSTYVGGIEADMAIQGALTTPGSQNPAAVLDLGAGSTDASYSDGNNQVASIHLAGAGNMVTLMIDTELGLNDLMLAEDIKKYPLARVESLFHIRHEEGGVEFFEQPLDAKIFSRVVILHEDAMIPIPTKHSMESIRMTRRSAKQKVFVTNAIRALEAVSPDHNIRHIEHVLLVGGSALDFETPQMITNALADYGVIAGRGNIRAKLGPRNAVATGLVLTHRARNKACS